MSRRQSPTRGLVLTATVLALIAGACGSSAASADQASALDQALRSFVHRGDGPPGIAVVIQRDQAPVLHQAGTAIVGTRRPVRITDHLRLASVAKAFSGATALALVAHGDLRLDTTIGSRLPGLPPLWAPITLAQLLHHTSGIPDFSQSPAFQQAVGNSLLHPPAPRALLDFVATDPLEFTPGSRYAYSNTDNIIVGLMAEAASGHTYPQELARLVFGPLRLANTSLPLDAAIPAPTVHGYAIAPPDPPDDVTNLFAAGWSWASGGIVSSPGDANRFVRAYVRGTLTNAATRRAQRDFVAGGSEPPGPGRNRAGLALFEYRTRCGTAYGHTGNTPGYTAFIAANGSGTRSTSVTINAQITPKSAPRAFRALRSIFELAVCEALH